MNKKYYLLTAIFILTSPLVLQWISQLEWISVTFIFSVIFFPLILGLTSYLWKLPTQVVHILYIIVLSVSAVVSITPILSFERIETIVLNFIIQFVMPIILFEGGLRFITIKRKFRLAS